ncbi:hypothetical protein JMF89_14090 [Clostridiaceae bacterium UIB06]|nr:hypothetical protein [Clostridiaceae bacterium UIB06]
MRIGTVSNTIFSSMRHTAKVGNNPSNKDMSPLEKQKLQLQEQIQKIEQSDSSKENKEKAIKDLEEKLEEIEQKLAQEKLTNPNGKSEAKKAKDKENEQQKSTEENKENGEGINKDVIIGIVSGQHHQKIGKAAYSVYRAAELRGDRVTAERALNYTTSEIKEVSKSTKLIEKGIKEYKKQMDNIKKADISDVSADNTIRINSDDDRGDSNTAKKVDSLDTSKVTPNIQVKGEASVKETLKK